MYNVIIIGASGHGRVIADIIIKSGDKVGGFLDDSDTLPKEIIGYPLLGKIRDINDYPNNNTKFIIGIGDNLIRKKISDSFNNISWYTAIHPSAQIALNTEVGEGTAVMANAVINSSSIIGKHCIINTGSIVEHDNVIKDFVHISPSAVLGGTVTVGEFTHIGIGAVVKNNTYIMSGVIIGAGAVVLKDINEKGTYVGVPARNINK